MDLESIPWSCPVEKVFYIDGLRLLILSFYLDKVKKIKKPVNCLNKINYLICLPFNKLVYYIIIKLYHIRYIR